METVGDFEWAGEPWWADAVDESDVVDCPEQWAVPVDAESFAPLSVSETLLAASVVGPGAEAIRLLTSLRPRSLTEDQRLSVLQLWQPQLAWVSGAEQTALLDLV